MTRNEKNNPLIGLLRRGWPKRSRCRVLLGMGLVVLAAVLGPYGFSRTVSASRALEVVELEVAVPETSIRTGGSSLRIACYNIAHGRGLANSNWDGGTAQDREQRLDEIAALLVEFDADLVVLNEVDFNATWSSSIDQAEYLAQRAGYPHVAKLSNLDFCLAHRSWRFGNAVLSRYPIRDAHEVDVPSYRGWEAVLAGKKRVLFCEVEVRGRSHGVLAAHLSHRSEALRVASARRLLDFASSYNKPLILAGDLNSSPSGLAGSLSSPAGENAMDVLNQSGRFTPTPTRDSSDPSAYSYRADRPARTIDWILLSEDYAVNDRKVLDSLLSDHRPVVAEVQLIEPEAAE